MNSPLIEYDRSKFSWNGAGLEIAPDVSWDEWLQFGAVLHYMERNVQLAIGDWLNYGRHRWGEKYAQAVDEKQARNWANYSYVASNVPPDLRAEDRALSYSHYSAVAPLSRSEQKTYLNQAERQGWSVSQLRKEIKGEGEPMNESDYEQTLRRMKNQVYLDTWEGCQVDRSGDHVRISFQNELRLHGKEIPGADILVILHEQKGRLADWGSLSVQFLMVWRYHEDFEKPKLDWSIINWPAVVAETVAGRVEWGSKEVGSSILRSTWIERLPPYCVIADNWIEEEIPF